MNMVSHFSVIPTILLLLLQLLWEEVQNTFTIFTVLKTMPCFLYMEVSASRPENEGNGATLLNRLPQAPD